MNPSDFFSKITTKADIAAACLGFATGFLVDVFLFPVGVPPGTTAGVFAVGAVGLKNSIGVGLDKSKSAKEKKNRGELVLTRATRLLDFLRREPQDSAAFMGAEILSRDIELMKLGVLSDAQIERSLRDAASNLRLPNPPNQLSSISTARFAFLSKPDEDDLQE